MTPLGSLNRQKKKKITWIPFWLFANLYISVQTIIKFYMSQFLYMTSGDLEFQFSCSVLSTLCYTIDCSMPCLPVCHQHPEHAQTHVHWDSDTIQPSHPLLSSSPPTFSLFQHQGLFQWVGSSHDGQSIGASASATDLPVNIQDWFPLGLTDLISLQSKGLTRLFQHHG